MASRKEKFINGDYFHIYNKNIEPLATFSDAKIVNEFINSFIYYRSNQSITKFSEFKKLNNKIKQYRWREIMSPEDFRVDILAFNIMPNHYHFLIKQLNDGGIVTFMSNLANSITRFYNVKNKRLGPIFLPQFKSKRINSIEQLVYVSRYIHTNQYASGLIKNINDIFECPYSSIKEYIGDNKLLINTEVILNYFNNDRSKFKEFITKNADDQKQKKYLNHLHSTTPQG